MHSRRAPYLRQLEFPYSRRQRQAFKKGTLSQEWKRMYPALFDKDDIRLAATQPIHHFYEWLAAILLYRSLGYLSLIEKYQYEKHTEKRKVIARLNSDSLNAALCFLKLNGRGQAPDLLVYSKRYRDWFFCEVKGENDRLNASQQRHFQSLMELTRKTILIVKFYAIED